MPFRCLPETSLEKLTTTCGESISTSIWKKAREYRSGYPRLQGQLHVCGGRSCPVDVPGQGIPRAIDERGSVERPVGRPHPLWVADHFQPIRKRLCRQRQDRRRQQSLAQGMRPMNGVPNGAQDHTAGRRRQLFPLDAQVRGRRDHGRRPPVQGNAGDGMGHLTASRTTASSLIGANHELGG